MGHAAFVDRLGDTFRWKGENVATTDVEAALSTADCVEECTVFGVEVPDTGGRAGMAAIKVADGASFDGLAVANALYSRLPDYAVPLFVRLVDSLEVTSTFKSRKVDLREQAYGSKVDDPLYVLAGRADGYVPICPVSRRGVRGPAPSLTAFPTPNVSSGGNVRRDPADSSSSRVGASGN